MSDDLIKSIEAFYKSRTRYLVKNERLQDAHSIFLEFVVDGKDPKFFYSLRKIN